MYIYSGHESDILKILFNFVEWEITCCFCNYNFTVAMSWLIIKCLDY